MEHAHAFAKLLQHRNWILTRLGNPVAVHFETDQCGIGILDKHIETGRGAELAELVIVIVEAKAHAQTPRPFPPLIELAGSPTKVIDGVPKVLRQHRADHKAHAQLPRVIELGRKPLVIEVSAGHLEPCVEDHLAQLFCWARIDVPVSLDLVVTDRANLLQQGSQIGFGLPAHSVELYTERRMYVLAGKEVPACGKRSYGGKS